ncbi:MAG TPA: ATP-binding protein [Candidatus Dormibacteraeota bacterium]|jgi:PAS domain S-box-containing protein
MNRRLGVGVAAVVMIVVAYAALVGGRAGGEATAVAVEDYGRAVAALSAVVACSIAARRAAGPTRIGWSLLALSALSWGAGTLYGAVSEVNLGVAAPFPSLADAGHLAAVPLAAAALLAFPFGPATAMGRIRLVLDSLSVATSLAYIAWSVGLGSLESQARTGVLGGLLLVAYPAADLVLLTMIAMSVRRAAGEYPLLARLFGAAFLCNLVADASFAYFALHGQGGALGGLSAAGWVAGYLVLALAAVAGISAPAARSSAADEVGMGHLALPWIGVAGVIAASIWVAATGRQTGVTAALIGSGMGIVFISSQVLTLRDALGLLVRSRRAESELRERTALLVEITERSPLGIARITEDLHIIDVNPRLSEMLAVPARALAGAPLGQFLGPGDVEKALARNELMKSGRLSHAEVDGEMRSADGRTFWVHRRVTPVFKANGLIHYFLVMFEDVSEKHRLEEAALANLAELERISRLKSEFLSMVSHEFRTALTGIQGYSEVLTTDEVTTDEVKEFAGDVNSEAQRLNRMITEMLDMDRIESGRIQLHLQPVDLNELVTQVVERSRMLSTKHSITIALDPSAPCIEGDSDRLTQVVSNLLTNAVKYSPGGGEILVSTRVADGHVEVAVQDHGQGIPPEFVTKIFGRYERYESAGAAKVVGTGLGLAISQQIVQLHKGRIWVESVVGAGSIFRFIIPLSPAAASATVAAPR